ncbi:Ankyrin repeat and FYVE domain-containing protein 1 [Dimargaris xerosporica]|nr:Ankyrin repeat and FYVE domain-containing protein 1 [Dimargaris xerosporica]
MTNSSFTLPLRARALPVTPSQPDEAHAILFAYYFAIITNDPKGLEQVLKNPQAQRYIDSPLIRDAKGGFNGLMLAGSLGHTECMQALVDHGANVNYRVDGKYPIFWALQNLKGLQQLVTYPQLNLHVRDQQGLTPIERARQDNALESVAILTAALAGSKALPKATSFASLQTPTKEVL